MLGRGSIARLMVVVGLSALAMTLLRAWLGPSNFLGFFGPTAILVLFALIGTLWMAGRVRRFCLGFAAVAMASGVANLIAPHETLGWSNDYLILPVLNWFNPRSGWLTGLEFAILWSELGEWPGCGSSDLFLRFHDQFYVFGNDAYCQSLMVIPQVVLAVLAGLIAAGFRSGSTSPPSPSDRP